MGTKIPNQNNEVQSKKESDEPIKILIEADSKQDDDDEDRDDDKEIDNDGDNDEVEMTIKGQATDVSKEELALRIYNTITSTILPQLHKCVTKKASL